MWFGRAYHEDCSSEDEHEGAKASPRAGSGSDAKEGQSAVADPPAPPPAPTALNGDNDLDDCYATLSPTEFGESQLDLLAGREPLVSSVVLIEPEPAPGSAGTYAML